MRWKQKESKPEKWFAWYPVQIGTEYIWGEWLYRLWVSAADQGFWQYGETPDDCYPF